MTPLPGIEFDGDLVGTSTEVLQEILYRYSAIERRDLGAEVYDEYGRAMAELS